MAITTRTLFIATFIGFSILCLSLYIYSNGYYKNKQLSKDYFVKNVHLLNTHRFDIQIIEKNHFYNGNQLTNYV